MWTQDEADAIQAMAREAKPDIVTYAIPFGLQVEKGPDAIVEHLCSSIPAVLDKIVARRQSEA